MTAVVRNEPDRNGFNRNLPLPFNLRLQDFELAMQDVYFNGHPDLLLQGHYPNDKARAGDQGVEIKTTRKPGGAVDTRGARSQWMCVFVFLSTRHAHRHLACRGDCQTARQLGLPFDSPVDP